MTGMSGPVEGLLADVTEMTRQAAADGLDLATVFADLRLVLEIDAADDLPADVLRACAVAWGQAHHELDRAGDDVGVLSWEGLEDRLWRALGAGDVPPPRWVVLVSGSTGGTCGRGLLSTEDVLHSAAGLLAARLDEATEHVALLPVTTRRPAVVMALLPSDGGRVREVSAWVTGLSLPGVRLSVTVHRLEDDPGGVLAALRQIVLTRTD